MISDDEETYSTRGELDRVDRVWILGSGFSRPLGGPLLNDLLSPRFKAKIEASYPDIDYLKGGATFFLYHLFWYGQELNRFEHAEDFLVQLNDVSTSGETLIQELYREMKHKKFPSLKNEDGEPSLENLRRLASHLVAAECNIPSASKVGHSEPYLPFQAWAERLSASDAIISFNYDRVVEDLFSSERIRVVGPDDPRQFSLDTLNTQTWLFKMHGSIDWFSNDSFESVKSVTTGPSPSESVGSVPVIGVPGGSKLTLSKAPLFKDIWGFSREALRRAKEIHIIGYSMPTSDSFAMRHILESLKMSQREYLNINIVLGNQAFATARLSETLSLALSHRIREDNSQRRHLQNATELLKGQAAKVAKLKLDAMCPKLGIRVWSAFAQDYLSAWSPS